MDMGLYPEDVVVGGLLRNALSVVQKVVERSLSRSAQSYMRTTVLREASRAHLILG